MVVRVRSWGDIDADVKGSCLYCEELSVWIVVFLTAITPSPNAYQWFVSIRSRGDRANHSIGWFELDGGFKGMSTKLRILILCRNRPIFLPPSNYRST